MGMFIGEGTPVLLQTITVFEGRGLLDPQPLELRYRVPPGRTLGMLYFRAGSTVSGLVNVSITRDGALLRYFPVAANSAIHVSLAIVEEHPAGALLEVWAAGEGSGTLILDIGYLEV
ncbi:MAG: molybdopterin oxidoreductase [Herpetosiphonaceae bacterium]|nr:molybdopterin oxidoreductase [Herpetosiphonaceae bacterium]